MIDARLIVPMPKDLREWCHQQAAREDRSVSGWVRYILTKIRSGEGIPGLHLPRAPQLQNPLGPEQPPVLLEVAEYGTEQQVDTHAILANALAAAEEAGLTQAAEQSEEPQSTIRPLRRPQSRYSPGNQSHINKYLP